jgi:hypothetical protein
MHLLVPTGAVGQGIAEKRQVGCHGGKAVVLIPARVAGRPVTGPVGTAGAAEPRDAGADGEGQILDGCLVGVLPGQAPGFISDHGDTSVPGSTIAQEWPLARHPRAAIHRYHGRGMQPACLPRRQNPVRRRSCWHCNGVCSDWWPGQGLCPRRL